MGSTTQCVCPCFAMSTTPYYVYRGTSSESLPVVPFKSQVCGIPYGYERPVGPPQYWSSREASPGVCTSRVCSPRGCSPRICNPRHCTPPLHTFSARLLRSPSESTARAESEGTETGVSTTRDSTPQHNSPHSQPQHAMTHRHDSPPHDTCHRTARAISSRYQLALSARAHLPASSRLEYVAR